MSSRITAEEVMLLMLYGAEMILMPTRHKYGTSYEQWLFHNGLLGRLHYLHAQRFVERQRHAKGWGYKLTKTGRDHARQQQHPSAAWDRSWDGWWRQISFDLPLGPI
jgi:hypothetical protein